MRGAFAVVALIACAAAIAEQAPILLRNGAGSAEGRLRGRQHRTYSLELSAQVLQVEMAVQPIRSAVLELYAPDGARVMLVKEGAGRWIASLPKPGRYMLVVARAVPSAPMSWYRLRVSSR